MQCLYLLQRTKNHGNDPVHAAIFSLRNPFSVPDWFNKVHKNTWNKTLPGSIMSTKNTVSDSDKKTKADNSAFSHTK